MHPTATARVVKSLTSNHRDAKSIPPNTPYAMVLKRPGSPTRFFIINSLNILNDFIGYSENFWVYQPGTDLGSSAFCVTALTPPPDYQRY
jgi:hypothetical protein